MRKRREREEEWRRDWCQSNKLVEGKEGRASPSQNRPQGRDSTKKKILSLFSPLFVLIILLASRVSP
jgi:hypothetical protein